jgi:hypothetical protein
MKMNLKQLEISNTGSSSQGKDAPRRFPQKTKLSLDEPVVKLCGKVGCLMDNPSSNLTPKKPTQSWESQILDYLKNSGSNKKPQNRRAFHEFGGARSPRKEAQ